MWNRCEHFRGPKPEEIARNLSDCSCGDSFLTSLSLCIVTFYNVLHCSGSATNPSYTYTHTHTHTYIYICACLVAQSMSDSDPMDCSSPSGTSVHGILQTKILEWVAIPFSRGSSWPRDWTGVPCVTGRFFTIWATREALGSPMYTHTHSHIYVDKHIFKYSVFIERYSVFFATFSFPL